MSAEANHIATLVELRRWHEARTALATLLASDPDDPDLHELDAEIHAGLDDHRAALASAGRAAALAPAREAPHRMMAYAHHACGDDDAAYRAAREAQRLAPSHWAAHAAAAMMAAEAGRDAEGVAAAERAASLDPENASALFPAAYVAQVAGRRREARRRYRAVLAIDPLHTEALNNLVMVSRRGRPGYALRGFAGALRVDPLDEVPLANLAALAVALLKRILWSGLAAVVAGVLLTGLGSSPVNPLSQGAGALVALVVLAQVLAFATGCSAPVRAALRLRLAGMWELWTVLAGCLGLLALGESICWIDGVARVLCQDTYGLFVWLLFGLPLRILWKRRRRRTVRTG